MVTDFYFGQTDRSIQVRLKEHKRATERGNILESGVAEHAQNTEHRIDWEAQIIDQDQNQHRRLVREAAHIRLNCPTMNRETGLELSRAYDYLFRSEGSSTSAQQSESDH